MSETDIKNKNLVLIDYLRSITDYIVRAEYSTNDEDEKKKIIVVQETSGQKVVFYEAEPLYNYYNIDIFGNSIKDAKDTSVIIGNLIGKNIYFKWDDQQWQIMIKQFSNPRTIEYSDIRRVSYTLTLQCIVNRIS